MNAFSVAAVLVVWTGCVLTMSPRQARGDGLAGDDAPAPALPSNGQVSAQNRHALLPRVKVNGSAERIYGVTFEVVGPLDTFVKPYMVRTFTADGTLRQQDRMNKEYATAIIEADPAGATNRFEIFTKRGAAELEIEVEVYGAGEVLIRNVQVHEAGWPDDTPTPGAPYLDWIDSLKPNPDYARQMRMNLKPRNPGAEPSAKVQPFMDVPLKDLTTYGPIARPFSGSFAGIYREIHTDGDAKYGLTWDPRKPDELRDRNGKLIDLRQIFPITGHEEVTGTNGVVHKYPYHDPPNARPATGTSVFPGDIAPSPDRVYLDNIMADVRAKTILDALREMGPRYHHTRDRETGVRAALLLYGLSQAIPNWPFYGTLFGSDHRRFQDPDAYDAWFAFPIIQWSSPYYGGMGEVAELFAMIDDPEVWAQASKVVGEDARARIANDGLLHLAKVMLKINAYSRINPWIFYHNTIGGELSAFMKTGRAIGEPELVHYAINKALYSIRATFMPDGMFPESTSYHDQMIFGLGNSVLWPHEGYTDPAGYVSRIDGTRIDKFKASERAPFFALAQKVSNRLRYPDGTVNTVHDTWATMTGTPRDPERDVEPFLLTDFGHAMMGRGAFVRSDRAIEAHLHYSGWHGHGHYDALNFTLWAYGDEVLPDLGYTHMHQYPVSTPAHNLVVVDMLSQKKDYNVGNLLAWHGSAGTAQVAQAESNPFAYDGLSAYRRAIVMLPFEEGFDAVVDIFEVKGGSRHDWMAQGVADYGQDLSTNLEFTETREAVSDDGQIVNDPLDPSLRFDVILSPTVQPNTAYRAFRNGRYAPITAPWQVTMTPQSPLPPGTPGAGRRATYTGERPGLRLHWLAPLDGTAIVAEAPRHRYPDELRNKAAARDTWSKNLLHKIIVRRDGENLDSTFVALWEPFRGTAWVETCQVLPDIPTEQGVAIALEGAGRSATVVYRKPGVEAATLTAGGLSTDGAFASVRTWNGSIAMDLHRGTFASYRGVTIRVQPSDALEIVAHRPGERDEFDVRGDFRSAVAAPGSLVAFKPDGASSRWLPIGKATAGDAEGKFVLSREAGFIYNVARERLRETFYPFHFIAGRATLELPVSVSATWSTGDRPVMRLRSTHALTVTLDAPRDAQIEVRNKPGAAWRAAEAVETPDGGRAVRLSVDDLVAGEIEIRVQR